MVITPLPPCSHCHERPRRPGQRWCQPCANAYKSARYWQRRTAAVETVQAVTPAPILAERPLVLRQLCGYADWFEWTPGNWRCRLCGRAP